MPISNKKSKGNLYIKFNINFPKQIDQKIKDELRKLFN
jgi:DnaJ-class molecular chaperone